MARFERPNHRGVPLFAAARGVTAALRACVLPPAATEDDLVVLLDEIRAAAKELAA
ncbi:hypothetical protein ABT061_00195 [Streptosporangium sp. NPDC002544]|uniref:hypothetical protein n=1 Tax=Streptosporangium sp. NPDC002544 TaxID=3154538 RepID=UPI003322E903